MRSCLTFPLVLVRFVCLLAELITYQSDYLVCYFGLRPP